MTDTHRPGLPEKLSTNPPFTKDTGIGPERLLFDKLMEFGNNSDRLSGILPVKRLFERSRTLRDFSQESELGMEDESLLLCKNSVFSFLKLPISEGIGPDRRLLLRSIFTRLVAREILGGIAPEILFHCRSSSDKFLGYPIVSAMGPVKLLSPKSMIEAWGRLRSPSGMDPSKRFLLTRNLKTDSHFV